MSFLWSDMERHWANGLHFWDPSIISSGDALMYQVFLYLVQKLTQQNVIGINFICGLLAVATPYFFYRAMRELKVSKNYALVLFALVVWLPSLASVFHYFLTETLLLFLLGLGLWMMGRYLRKGDFVSFLTSVVVWTLACLTKSSVLLLALVCVAYSLVHRPQSLKNIAAVCVLTIFLLLPSAVRSYRILGFSAPLGSVWINKILFHSGKQGVRVQFKHTGYGWIFGSPSSHIRPLEPLSQWQMKRAGPVTWVVVEVDPTRGKLDWVEAHRELHYSWGDWWQQQRENFVLLFFAPSWPESYSPYEVEGRINYLQRWIWAPLIFYIFVGNVILFCKRQFDFIPLIMTVFFFFLLFQNVTIMEGRYRKPLEPLVLMNGVYLMERSERRNSRGLKKLA
ncbi:MAG: glycosyltransferase family 39 protein [bacterium]